MFDTSDAIRRAKERATAEEAFEALRLADLTVEQFRTLMAQIAWDERNRQSPRSFMDPRPPTPIE